MTILIKSGTRCFLSEPGHKDFLYPSKVKAKLKRDTRAERLFWSGSNDLCALKVLSEDLNGVTWPEKYTAIWISKEDLKSFNQ